MILWTWSASDSSDNSFWYTEGYGSTAQFLDANVSLCLRLVFWEWLSERWREGWGGQHSVVRKSFERQETVQKWARRREQQTASVPSGNARLERAVGQESSRVPSLMKQKPLSCLVVVILTSLARVVILALCVVFRMRLLVLRFVDQDSARGGRGMCLLLPFFPHLPLLGPSHLRPLLPLLYVMSMSPSHFLLLLLPCLFLQRAAWGSSKSGGKQRVLVRLKMWWRN